MAGIWQLTTLEFVAAAIRHVELDSSPIDHRPIRNLVDTFFDNRRPVGLIAAPANKRSPFTISLTDESSR